MFHTEKREHKIASLNFASKNILLAPIKGSGLTAAYIGSSNQLPQNCSKTHAVKYGPEGITWVKQKGGLGWEAVGKCLLLCFGPQGPRDCSEPHY